MTRRALGLLLCALAGCRSAHTDLNDALPDLEPLLGGGYLGARFEGEAAELELDADPVGAGWWKRLGDPVLDALVAEARAGNLDLAQAAANVRAAQAALRSAHGTRGPSVDAGFGVTRQKNILPGIASVTNTVLNPTLTIAWQADLFGRLAAAERAQLASLLASEGDRLALTHTLIADVVRRRVESSVLARRLELARAIVASRTNTLQAVRGRYERGVAGSSAVDVHLAAENLAAARAALPPLAGELERTLHALDLLLGRKPGSRARAAQLAPALPDVPAPPLDLPAALLDRRPDLVAARLRAAAGAADVDVSIAALRPDLALSASGGWTALRAGDLFMSDAFGASVVARLAAPLFASGRLRAEVDAARARLDALAASYAARVLGALREVEDALSSERALRDELALVRAQETQAERAEGLARERYGRGLESLLVVLDTERRRAAAQDRALRLEAAVWNARVDLILALGGDWLAPGASEDITP